ncbi:MAG: N-acetyltransferase [Bacteroidia bacterium]|nr:N-acetyltransferase [Bacteroidia bacterium]NNK70053.1 N-acetyltransferase [Flavobacteriaceae bacterium]NNL80062.1 N-acetyltransferase [Flavobacteriaceae bacterium]
MDRIQYKQAETIKELEQILSLQTRNLRNALSPDLKKSEGFLTVKHDLELLKDMNSKCPHIIAIHDKKVIGYALSMHPDFAQSIDILKPLFELVSKQVPRGINYIVMGQICIDKAFRKQGVFKGLYNFMKSQLMDDFDWIITEVDKQNQRSLEAHLNTGFKPIIEHRSNQRDWMMIYLPTQFRNSIV